jgi:tryptophan 2,3-dioxygenase
MSKKKECYYADYLNLDKVLAGIHAARFQVHDEHLFIIVHQSHELWFKQLLFEFHSVIELLATNQAVFELPKINARLGRCQKIIAMLINQFEILETMTPMSFLAFRDKIIPASGFQSLQFRLIEQALGVDIAYAQVCPHYRLNDADFEKLKKAQHQITLRDILIQQLANLPFSKLDLPNFWHAYQQQVLAGFSFEKEIIEKNSTLSLHEQNSQFEQINQNLKHFERWFDDTTNTQSNARFVSLYIFLHHETEKFSPWYQLLKSVMDIDEAICLWRYHHYMMVQRMIGHKIGTGGSSGQSYLKKHLEDHRAFIFLFDIINFLLPRQLIPET